MEMLEQAARTGVLGRRAQQRLETRRVGEPAGLDPVAVDQPVGAARRVQRARRDVGKRGGPHRYL
jgi:hypothetical protein